MKRLPFNTAADNQGIIPEAGDYVAYNYSGQIALGTIVRVGRARWGPTYIIQQSFPNDNHVSRVRGGPKCVLVLKKGDT